MGNEGDTAGISLVRETYDRLMRAFSSTGYGHVVRVLPCRGSDRGEGEHPVPPPGRGHSRRGSPRAPRTSRPSSRRTVPCSSRATGGARGCSRSSITTRRWHPRGSGACPLPTSTAAGEIGPVGREELLARLHGLGGPVRQRLSLRPTHDRIAAADRAVSRDRLMDLDVPGSDPSALDPESLGSLGCNYWIPLP
jgi:hypothetical protein